MASLYSCEELLQILKDLMTNLQNPVYTSGGSSRMKADDMEEEIKTSSSSGGSGILTQIRFFYDMYIANGCEPITEIETILNQPQVIQCGRYGYSNGKRLV